jgi:phytoene dehydrogenase-like protein
MAKTDFDAIVIGSGPNGLSAAVALQQTGLYVLLLEARATIGGGLRSDELTLPGFIHDICSAIHPLALASPFFRALPLDKHGLEYIQPPVAAAHPFDDGTTALLTKSLDETVNRLGKDGEIYRSLIGSLAQKLPTLATDILAPLRIPKNIIDYFLFGLNAILPASQLVKRFSGEALKGLWGGMAAHSMLPLSSLTTSAIGLVLMSAGHAYNWPIPKGGSQKIADALASYFLSIGGKIETNFYVKSLQQLPSAKAVLFDISPKQLLEIAGHKFSSIYKWQLEKYRYGMGVFKIDWALAEPVPFTAKQNLLAGTVHLGGSFREIEYGENETSKGKHPDKPFVLLAQQSLFDQTRAPEGKHTLWGYCHVPSYSNKDMTDAIERQIERFAPGFRERILARHVMNSSQIEEHNPNYVGGDINGGAIDWRQLFTRPALRWSPYRTSTKGLYICSASTPPGGGVHGMCGYHAAQRALKDLF